MSATEIRTVGCDVTKETLESILLEDGCVIVENAIDSATIDLLMEDLEPYLRDKPTGRGDFAGFRTRRLHGLFTKSASLEPFILHGTVLSVMDITLKPFCDTFQLSSNSITSIGPEETVQPLHRDDLLYPLAHPTERNALCTAFWALSDFTANNGATRLIPGSHRWDDQRKPREEETVQAVMKKGSICFFVGAVYHGGGANVTKDEWRTGMYSGYCLGWLRQEQNFYLSVPPEIARSMPERLARLLGYSVHRPFLGWVQDFKDPWEAIQGYEELSEGDQDLYSSGSSDPVQANSVKLV